MEYYDEDNDYDPDNEESDNEESDSRNDGSNSTEREITRGITLMKNVIRARDKGVKYEVSWNVRNQPIGTYSATFASFVGADVRRHIPITCDQWKSTSYLFYHFIYISLLDIGCYLSLIPYRKSYIIWIHYSMTI